MHFDWRATQKRRALPDGPRGLPAIGNLAAFQKDAPAFLLEAYRRYGDLVTLRVPGAPRIGVFGPSLVNEILVAPEDQIGKTGQGGFLGLAFSSVLGGSGITSTTGDAHRRHRQIVLRVMGKEQLREYQDLIRGVTAREIDSWRPGTEIDLRGAVVAMGKRTAHHLLFGVDPSVAGEAFGVALDAVAAILDEPSLRYLTATAIPWDVPGISNGGTIRRYRAVIDAWLRGALADGATRSVGRALLEHGQEIDPAWGLPQVRDNLIQLFMTGYDTTTCAIVWTLYLLAQHPDACARVLAEIRDVLGDRSPDVGDLAHLAYLDAAVKESLRLYPTGPYAFREALRPFDLAGYALDRGTVLVYSPWVTHRIPAVYPDPETFRPERFLKWTPPKGAYVPFGQGARSCVAATLSTLQIKTTVAMLLAKFRFDIVPDQHVRAVSVNAMHLLPELRVRVAAQDGRVELSPAKIYGNVVAAQGGA